MDMKDERELLRRFRKRRGDHTEDLDELHEHFEDPEHSDILIEKQVKEGKKKR